MARQQPLLSIPSFLLEDNVVNRWIVLLSALGSFFGGLAVGALGMNLFHPAPTSPYVDQAESPVRGLSAQEIDDLLNGRGAGYARTAELNSYPGPRHVLDLKQELSLSPSQAAAIDVVFKDMHSEAQRIGKLIVDQEAALSRAFAAEAIAPETLDQRTQDLAALYGELRTTHLEAHLDITPLLSAEQIERYDQLRGYTGSSSDTPSTNSHQH